MLIGVIGCYVRLWMLPVLSCFIMFYHAFYHAHMQPEHDMSYDEAYQENVNLISGHMTITL